MKMEPLKGGSLRIWMTHTDMRHWGLCFEDMDARDETTRRALLRLVGVARERLAFCADGELTVEALPLADGCLLLMTPHRTTPLLLPAEPTVYVFHNADDLLSFGKSLPSGSLPAASLFAWGRQYRLIVYPERLPHAACRRLLSEFADVTAKGYPAAAYTEERGHPLVIGEALYRLRH